MKIAPIVLFVYNRPWHTLQTLNALMLNELADKSILYIYCDGAKENATKEELGKIKEVREVIRKKKWCKEVNIIEREDNIGLANSVITGVSNIIKKYGKIIVLEDDIETSKFFLKFMNKGLEIYKGEKQVYGVSGYCFPYSGKIKESTFFLPIMSSWGYGIWLDRWEKINFNGEELFQSIVKKSLQEKLNFGNLNFYQMLQDQVEKRNDSWAIRFYVSMFLDKGYFLYPKYSLIKNIGLDGSGVHCTLEEKKFLSPSNKNKDFVKINKIRIKIRKQIIDKFKTNSNKTDKMKRFKQQLKQVIAPELKTFIRRKFYKTKTIEPFLKLPRFTKAKVLLKGRNIEIVDNASFVFMSKEIFEKEIYQFKTINDEPYIIDGGANIGLATIYLKLNHPNSKIVCFEPDKEIFNVLKKNINSFNFENITLFNKGLWDKEEELMFKNEGADGGLIKEKSDDGFSYEKINVVSLKPYIKKKVDFLKLDIEGAEIRVLRDIKEDLDKVERIFVEYHSFVGEKQTLNEVIDILYKANFRLYISSPGDNSLNSPLLGLEDWNGMDLQLNIFGYKE